MGDHDAQRAMTMTLTSDAAAKKVWTEAEFMALLQDRRYQLVHGEGVEMGSSRDGT